MMNIIEEKAGYAYRYMYLNNQMPLKFNLLWPNYLLRNEMNYCRIQ